jgi:hypothetical protein
MAMAAFDAVTMPNEVVLAWPLRGWSAWNAILRARLAHLERLREGLRRHTASDISRAWQLLREYPRGVPSSEFPASAA